MGRAPFEVLVLPYALDAFPEVAYAVFRSRADRDGCWHGLGGGGVRDETPLQAARRHAWQHAGVPGDAPYVALDSRATIPTEWRTEIRGLPEYAFAVRVDPTELCVPEHEHCWVSFHVAEGLVRRESERNALWELRRRLGRRPACR
ncbi:MAG: NUDIX domain-containing protein [Solirubrobacteraceae bacterium]